MYSTYIPCHNLRTAKTDSSSLSSIFLQPPDARIVLRWVTFLRLDFWCTIQPMVHQIISGHPGGPYIFKQSCVTCSWVEGACQLVCVLNKLVKSLKGGSNLRKSLILVMYVSGLHIDLDQLKDEETP